MFRALSNSWALILLTGGLACHAATRSQTTDFGAWWLTARFEPTGTQIQQLPLSQLDSSWTGAVVLTRAVMPPEAAAYLAQPIASSARFQLDGDFNHDGIPDRILVGVYRTANDSAGRFLLILTRQGQGWIRAQVLKMPGEAGFSILTRHADTIGWWMCMERDDGLELKWDGHGYSPLSSAQG